MGTNKKFGVYLVVLVVVTGLAGIRYWEWSRVWDGIGAGSQIQIVERIIREPEERWGKRYLRLGRRGVILVQVPDNLSIHYGDKVKIIGKLEERVIDEKKVGFSLIYSDFNVILASKHYLVLNRWRNRVIDMVLKWLPGDEGGLAAGVLWGGDDRLSEKASENFRKSGLSHVVAASGYNVSVIAVWVGIVAIRLVGRRKSIYFVIVSMIMYVLMAGAQAAVVRAGIMAGLTTFALYSGRKTDGIWIWIVTGLAMLIISPAYFEDVGWQLSMAATAGLLWSGKLTSEKLLLTDLRTTLAAQVTTLPIVLHHFGNVSVVAPLANVLVLPVVPLVMQIVAGASLVGLLLDQLGMMISWLAYPLLRWMTLVTDFVGAWGWSSITVEKLGWGWVAGYYLLLVIISNYKFLIINKPR